MQREKAHLMLKRICKSTPFCDENRCPEQNVKRLKFK